jgi:aminoglycoside phosphotransferase (APT) family kinase protein
MDFGAALAYWIEAGDAEVLRQVAMGPTASPGMWSRRQLIESYAKGSGRAVEDVAFYYVFGLYKLAVIIQQIYARYVRGATSDSRFAGMNRMVAVLAGRAEAVAAGRGHI